MLLALLACAAAPAPGAAAAGGTDAVSSPHGPHGGELQTDGTVTAELRALPEGLLVWVGEDGAAPTSEGWQARARVGPGGPSDAADVVLHDVGDHLHAALPLAHGQPARVRLTLSRGAAAHVLDYRIAAVGLSGHDHTPLHGGYVAMWRDTHVEWAPRATSQRFFVTDARRASLTHGVSGVLEDDGRTLALTFDPASGALEAPADGARTRPVTLRARIGADSFELRFTPDMLATDP